MILMIRLELFIQQTYEWIFSLILMVLLSIYWPCMLFTHDCMYILATITQMVYDIVRTVCMLKNMRDLN